MDCRLAAFNAATNDRLDYLQLLQTVCKQLNDTVASSHVNAPSQVQASPAQPPQHQLDCSMNTVVFGVAVDRCIHLEMTDSTDMFKLGR